MDILSKTLTRKPAVKGNVKIDSQLVSSRAKEEFVQTKVQPKVAPLDITQEKWFWDDGVMS